MSAGVEIQIIAALAAAACALPGVFLVLRGMALMSDAISHVILLGIVIMFFIVGDLQSPLITVGAAASGLLTVFLIESLSRTGLVKRDAAIGIVFPLFFSLGVILVSRYAANIHLDVDAVLLGELTLAPFNRMIIAGRDLGPQGAWSMATVLALNVIMLLVFYKELKLATFDAGFAASLGFAPGLLHYGLMGLVSVSAVEAFDVVGAILVVALMVAPPAAAYLLTRRLSTMLVLAAVLGATGAIAGYWFSRWVNGSISGSMATMLGVQFALVYLFAPQRGLVSMAWKRKRQKLDFAGTMLTVHLFNHEDLPEAEQENRVAHLGEHLRWADHFAVAVVKAAENSGLVECSPEGLLTLTPHGRTHAREVMVSP